MILVRRMDVRRHRQQASVPSMRRFLTMLAFASCTIPIAACSTMQAADEPSGRADFEPVNCDPLWSYSPNFLALAVGPRDGLEIYSSFGPAPRTGALSAGSQRAVG